MLVSVTRMATPDAPSPDSSEGSDEEKLKDSLGTETTEYGECPTCRNLVLVTEHDGEKVYITHDYEIGGSTLDEEKACVGSGGVLEGRTYDTPLGDWQRTEVPADVFDELLKRLEQPAKVIPGLLRLLNDQKVKGLFQSLKPRDPDRIDEVLAELERIWRAHPDLRLTQLIANVLPGTSPHYNVEDTDLLENLRRVYP